ncbi:MAG TPA: alpha/beta fold hydrolase, partial [Blastocatellia bacterium]|nr:alpha/beta fold hydrolase [Blastocatellia bacterium]
MTSRILELTANHLKTRSFDAPRFLRNRHSMTIFAALYPRKIVLPESEYREFETEPGTRVVTHCHWQTNKHDSPTIILVHGLEGSAEARYVRGTAFKAFNAGFNVVRLNVRNCGMTSHLSQGLYHSGLTTDLREVTLGLIRTDNLKRIWWIGFSMGANHILKLAGEFGRNIPVEVKGLCAISPPIDLAICARDINRPENRIYERRFLRSLQATIHRKTTQCPGIVNLEKLARTRNLWEFDEVVTAPHFGFRDAR